MKLSAQTIETLKDLVEIKLSCLEIVDRDDMQEQMNLKRCLAELAAINGGRRGDFGFTAPKRRGRRPKVMTAAHI